MIEQYCLKLPFSSFELYINCFLKNHDHTKVLFMKPLSQHFVIITIVFLFEKKNSGNQYGLIRKSGNFS